MLRTNILVSRTFNSLLSSRTLCSSSSLPLLAPPGHRPSPPSQDSLQFLAILLSIVGIICNNVSFASLSYLVSLYLLGSSSITYVVKVYTYRANGGDLVDPLDFREKTYRETHRREGRREPGKRRIDTRATEITHTHTHACTYIYIYIYIYTHILYKVQRETHDCDDT